MSGLFITGVGTGVGKTLVTTILCHQLRAIGRSVLALKPVVSGFVDGDPASDPALILRSLGVAPTAAAIASISPWRFAAPISPHLAARREGRSVSLEEIGRFCREQAGGPGSIRLIEGAGGVMSPICENGTNLHLIARLGDPVVLVTGTYLGALSHTLTALGALSACSEGRISASGGRQPPVRSRRQGADAPRSPLWEPTLTGIGVPVRGIVVSESADGVGLAETVEALREFGAGDVPIYPLPRLVDEPGERWLAAPLLTGICEVRDD